MKSFWLLSALLATILGGTCNYADAARATRVRGGISKKGVYRQPHYRTAPDKSRYNNYGTKANSNPYTGKTGKRDPHKRR